MIGKANPTLYDSEEPIRAELFSVERLEEYARVLAAEHKIVKKKGRAHLLPSASLCHLAGGELDLN